MLAHNLDGSGQTQPSEGAQNFRSRRAREQVRARLFDQPPTPIRIGRFLVLEEVGAGGMGTVFAAHDPELGRQVALKVLTDPDAPLAARTRMRREAQALARLSHPNVVHVFDAGTEDDQVFIAMELVDGLTLDRWVQRHRPSVEEIVGVFLQAGRGLAAVHAAGLAHRDFKPRNVLVDHDGGVRVLDFGLACANADPSVVDTIQDCAEDALWGAPPGDSADLLDTPMTRTGALLGTPAYMAPEQHRREPIDGRTDQFAFCVALYEALYGERPFAGNTVLALADAACNGVVRSTPASTRVPRALRRVILRGLRPEPDERWASMEALMAALERFAHRPRRLERVALSGLFAVVGLIASLVLSGMAGGPELLDARAFEPLAASPADADRSDPAPPATRDARGSDPLEQQQGRVHRSYRRVARWIGHDLGGR